MEKHAGLPPGQRPGPSPPLVVREAGALVDKEILDTVVPDRLKRFLQLGPKERTVEFYLTELARVQGEIADTLDARNKAGVLLEARLGHKAREEVPGPRGIQFVPVSEEERKLYEQMAGFREAVASMGATFSLETWHPSGGAADGFAGPKARIPWPSRLDMEHLPMMAHVFGFTGVAGHTYLDQHPEDIRAFSLNLLARGLKWNSIFHGAFHGPIFAHGAMSSEAEETRFLARLLKQEAHLMSVLGWDAATAVEERLKDQLGQGKIDELRRDNVIVSALRDRGDRPLGKALTAALDRAGVENAGAVVEKMLKSVVSKPGCAEVCDWDGTDGLSEMESYSKPASLLGLTAKSIVGLTDELKPTLTEYLGKDVKFVDPNRPVTRMDLLVIEKIERILLTGGVAKIKIEPKFKDPSMMTEAGPDEVIEINRRVAQGIQYLFGAQILSENPAIGRKEFQAELAKRTEPYVEVNSNTGELVCRCVTGQIEEGHERQMPFRRASRAVEKLLHHGVMAGAYHMNWSANATGEGDPDYSVLVNDDLVRLCYVLLKNRLVGPNADETRRVAFEFDMAPRMWECLTGFLGSMDAVNIGLDRAQNLLKIEKALQATGYLTPEEQELQAAFGRLALDQGVFDLVDNARAFNIFNLAQAMPPVEELKHPRIQEAVDAFRKLVGRPYRLTATTAELAAMPDVAKKLAAVKP